MSTALMYTQTAPLSKTRHAQYSVQFDGNYAFAEKLTSLPLLTAEFSHAARDYAIVFVGNAEQNNLMPVVLVGIQQANLFLSAAGQWNASYIPAIVRQYPFVLASQPDQQTQYTLCLDEGFAGCNQTGQGARLFTDAGEPSDYLQSRIEFLKQCQTELQRTQQFARLLHEFGLLEPWIANLTLPSGEKIKLDGFMSVDRDKLKALSAEQLAQLVAVDAMELIYLHLQSMTNFTAIGKLIAQNAESLQLN